MTENQISNQEIIATMNLYGVNADASLCDKVRTYIALLLKWNQKIALTTVTNPNEIIRFHFCESLFAAPVVPIWNGRLADVGSGAGFPGLAIALFVENIEAVLIESNAKKAAFLSEVSSVLGLKGVEVFRGRMETIVSTTMEVDFITARALGQHSEFLKWSHKHLSRNGRVVMWLGEEDLVEISQNPLWRWDERIKIPQTQRRYLLIGSPIR